MIIGFIKPVVGVTIMGVMTNLIVKNNRKRGSLQAKMQALGIFMQNKKVAASTQHQVLAYLEHAEKQMETLSDLDAIQTLSPTLREEVAYHTQRQVLNDFVLFEVAFGHSFARQLCSFLKLELFGPDDVICQMGHFLPNMVFVTSGSLKLFSKKSQPNFQAKADGPPIEEYGEVPTGMTFGAQAVLQQVGYRSPFSVLCFVFCELTFLSRNDFQAVVARNPNWGEILKRIDNMIRRADDPAKIVAQMACGDEELMDLIAADSWDSNKSSFYGNALRRAVKQVKKLKSLLDTDPSAKGLGNFKCSGPTTSHRADSADNRTSGFSTIQMSPVERRVLQEFAKIGDKFDALEERLMERMDTAITSYGQDLEKRLRQDISSSPSPKIPNKVTPPAKSGPGNSVSGGNLLRLRIKKSEDSGSQQDDVIRETIQL